ncbi:unnamed protein product [Symbiodinium natans]|uniref:Uncharacterized protein n=1 Tax=Symbiodinium natans TaxID=878477 RepID=A0A812TV16_9DINO|nr:unnamed protein product [Symbiodinium natans]
MEWPALQGQELQKLKGAFATPQQLEAAFDTDAEAAELVEVFLPGISTEGRRERAQLLVDWAGRQGQLVKRLRRESFQGLWETLPVRSVHSDVSKEFDELARQNPLSLLPGLERRRRAARTNLDSAKRAQQESDEREKYTLLLADVIRQAKLPVVAQLDAVNDDGRSWKRIFGTRRSKTLRNRFRSWRAFSRWLETSYHKVWPSSIVPLLEYADEKYNDDCGKTVLPSFQAALSVLEQAGRVPEAEMLSRDPTWLAQLASYTADLEHRSLLPDGAYRMYTGHSPRNFLASVAAAIGVRKEDIDYLGRWLISRLSGAGDYIRTSREVVHRVQETVCRALLEGVGGQYHEDEALSMLKSYVDGLGTSGSLARRQHDILRRGDGQRHLGLKWPAFTPALEDPDSSAEDLEEAPVFSASKYFITTSSKTGLRRLHLNGPCHVKHYHCSSVVFVDQVNLGSWTGGCRGALHVFPHSDGGTAEMLALVATADSDLQYVLQEAAAPLRVQYQVVQVHTTRRRFQAIADTRAEARTAARDFNLDHNSAEGRAQIASVVAAWELAKEFSAKEVELKAEAKVMGHKKVLQVQERQAMLRAVTTVYGKLNEAETPTPEYLASKAEECEENEPTASSLDQISSKKDKQVESLQSSVDSSGHLRVTKTIQKLEMPVCTAIVSDRQMDVPPEGDRPSPLPSSSSTGALSFLARDQLLDSQALVEQLEVPLNTRLEPAPAAARVSGMQLRPPRAPPPRDVKAAVDKAIPASALSLWHELCEALMLVSPVLQQCAQCSSPSEATAKLLSLVAPSTAARYLQSFVRLQKALEELGVPCVTQVEPHHVLDALFILDRSKSDALSCVPNVLKAARWVFKILDLDVSSLYCPLIRALEVRPIRDRREAVPLLLAMVVALERIAMNTSEDGALRIFTGSVLVLLWASLRFSDGQHVQWDTILWDVASLRFVAEATKTTRGGMPAGCLVAGLLGDFDATSWCAHWLYLMGCCWDEMRRAGIITKPMGLFFTWSGSEFAPLSYAQALRLLRQVLLQSGFDATSVQSVTLHSAKVTLLAWSHEIGVCEEWRRVQGHHKGGPGASMPQLYSRNDVITQLRLQTVVRQQLLQGWRPMTVQARGARPPLLQPGVSLSSVGMLPAPEHSYFQRFPGGDSLPHSDGGAPAGILALAPAQQAEAAFSPCTEMEPPVCVGERAEPLPEEQRLELLQREAGSVSPPDSVAVDAFMQESSDEEVADAPDLGAADEFTLLRASSGVLHVAHALEQGKTACGVVSGLLEPVLEPGVGGRWCRRSACMRLRMQF